MSGSDQKEMWVGFASWRVLWNIMWCQRNPKTTNDYSVWDDDYWLEKWRQQNDGYHTHQYALHISLGLCVCCIWQFCKDEVMPLCKQIVELNTQLLYHVVEKTIIAIFPNATKLLHYLSLKLPRLRKRKIGYRVDLHIEGKTLTWGSGVLP